MENAPDQTIFSAKTPLIAHGVRLTVLAAFVALTSWIAVILTEGTAQISPLWAANGAILACLVFLAPKMWPLYILVGGIANAGGYVAAGDSLLSASCLSFINCVEVIAAALPLWWRCRSSPNLYQFPTLIKFVVMSVLLAPAFATVLAIASFWFMGQEPTSIGQIIQLYLADALGIAVVTPLYLYGLRGNSPELLRSKSVWSAVNWLALVTTVVAGVFYQTTYPFLFFIPPVLVAATVAQGFLGAGFYLGVLAVAALWGTMAGHGPFALSIATSLSNKLMFTQLFVLSNFVMTAYVAFTAEERRRVLAKLEEEHRKLLSNKQILSESEFRFRQLSEHSADIIFQTNDVSVIEYASPSVEEVLGWTPDDMIGHTANEFTHPDDVPASSRMIEELQRDTVLVTGRVRGLHKNGSYIWLERRARRIQIDGRFVFISNVRDISANKRAEELLEAANVKLSQIALVDSLTGIANRRRLDEALGQEWRRAERETLPLSLILLDVDRFKDYNDFYGHQGGDICLQAIAQCVAKSVNRPGDLVARYGGEEIALLLPNIDEKGADIIGENTRLAIESLKLPHLKNQSCGSIVTASIGVATFRPDIKGLHHEPSILVRMADMMLYEAKRSGRNKVSSPTKIEVSPKPFRQDTEEQRLVAVQEFTNKGMRQTEDLNRIAKLAAHLFQAPIGLVSIVGRDKQVFVGRFGLEATETSREVSFCAHTLDSDSPLVVGDAPADPRFKNNALVTGDMNIRFYAGAPLISSEQGHHLGALCVIDKHSRISIDPDHRKILSDLASLAVRCMEDASSDTLPLSPKVTP